MTSKHLTTIMVQFATTMLHRLATHCNRGMAWTLLWLQSTSQPSWLWLFAYVDNCTVYIVYTCSIGKYCIGGKYYAEYSRSAINTIILYKIELMFYKCLNNGTDTHTYWRGGNPCFLQTTTLNWLEVPLYAVTPPKKALLYPKCWMR